MLLTLFSLSACDNKNTQNNNSVYSDIELTTQTIEKIEIKYIGNKNTKKFHKSNCYTLPYEKNRINFSSYTEAINNGYSPCNNCNP